MAQIKIEAHVYAHQYEWETEPTYSAFAYPDMGDERRTYIGPVEIDYEVPADWNPAAAKLAALQAKRDAAAKQFADTVRKIDEQISKLTALEYTA